MWRMTEYQTVTTDMPLARTGAIKLHDAAGFEGMRGAGRLAAFRHGLLPDLADTQVKGLYMGWNSHNVDPGAAEVQVFR